MQSRAAASSKQPPPPCRASTLAVTKASGLTNFSINSNATAWRVSWRGAVASVHKGPRALCLQPPLRATGAAWTVPPLWLRGMDSARQLTPHPPRARRYKETCVDGNCEDTMFCADACDVVCPDWKAANCPAAGRRLAASAAGRRLGGCPCGGRGR